LLRQMEAEGLTERFRASAGTRSGVKVRLTAPGTGLVQSLLHTLLGQLPAVSAAIDNFVGSIPRFGGSSARFVAANGSLHTAVSLGFPCAGSATQDGR